MLTDIIADQTFITLLLNSLIYTFAYAIFETIFRLLKFYWTNDKQHKFTTREQLIITFIWSPVIDILIFESVCLSALVFPFHVWVCEIIFGHYLWKYRSGKRVWYYDDKFALFNGYISLSYIVIWMLLGIIVHMYRQHIFQHLYVFLISNQTQVYT